MENQGLFSYLSYYGKKDIYPFHMPGHKNNKKFFKNIDLLSLDYTEFGNMDNLHAPDGVIDFSQKRAAKIYGAKEAFFLVNGSTSGILAALLSSVSEGDKIILSRNCHKSVFDGLRLTGANPIYVYPAVLDSGIIGSVSPADIQDVIDKNPDAKAIFITSPTYDGVCSDIFAISQIAEKHRKILIVDEAHGAHFPFSEIFPKSSVGFSDITITSLHKTLPVLGQSSIMFLNSDILNKEILKKNISAVTTTSPSYILMGIMDYFFEAFYPNRKFFFDEYTDLLIKYIEIFKELSNIELFEKNLSNQENLFDKDISKLLFTIKDDKMKAFSLEKNFAENYKIQLEFSGLNYILALSTVCDTEKGFLRLRKALEETDSLLSGNAQMFFVPLPKTKTVLNAKEMLSMNTTVIPIAKSCGEISAEQIIPYPPGIPLLNTGELITKEILEAIEIYKTSGIKILKSKNTDIIEIYKNKS